MIESITVIFNRCSNTGKNPCVDVSVTSETGQIIHGAFQIEDRDCDKCVAGIVSEVIHEIIKTGKLK